MTHAFTADYSPGWAKRADTYEQTRARGRAWSWEGENRKLVEYLVVNGTPHLTLAQRCVLQFYVAGLNDEDLRANDATVWTGAKTACDRLGVVESALRRHRAALEAMGYLVRVYSKANRQAYQEGTDLAPTLARLEEMRDSIEATGSAADARWSVMLDPAEEATSIERPGAENSAPKQSLENISVGPVRGIRAPAERASQSEPPPAAASCPERRAAPIGVDPPAPEERAAGSPSDPGAETWAPTDRRRRREASANGSPGRALGRSRGPIRTSAPAEIVSQELQLACRLVPELAEVTPQRLLQDPAAWEGMDVLAAMAAADQLLPHPGRNNGRTLQWGWEKKGHGPRTIAMLAVAMLEPAARDRNKYFAGLALKPKPPGFDLRPNLLKLLNGRGQGGLKLVAPADSVARAREAEEKRAAAAAEALAKSGIMAAPGTDDPRWQAIDARLRAGAIRTGAYGAWFSRVGFHGIVDGVLMLSHPSPRAAERIRDEFARAVRDAAREAGHEVDQVMISTRKTE